MFPVDAAAIGHGRSRPSRMQDPAGLKQSRRWCKVRASELRILSIRKALAIRLERGIVFRSEVLRTLIESNPAGFLDGFKRAVELQKNKDLGPLAKLKQDYLGKIGPNSDNNDVGVNAINCISLYNTVCNRLRKLADLERENKQLSERTFRNVIRAIEALCSRLEIGLEDIVGWNRAAEPWARIKPRARVFIVTCERPYHRIDSHQTSVKATAFSVHDTYVYVHLHAFFAALPAKPTVQHVAVPHDLTVEQAGDRLNDLLGESPAAILTIGSSHGNPLTGACIHRAFDDVRKRVVPAKFVWRWPSKHMVEFLDTLASRELSHPGIFVAPDRYLRRSCEPDGLPDAGALDCRRAGGNGPVLPGRSRRHRNAGDRFRSTRDVATRRWFACLEERNGRASAASRRSLGPQVRG